ncbi:MAG: DnaJ domain-containing protein [Polyangiaceae bacterium]|nr:DnaJ domain-containing protein [Polyangiaceae bacterium]
MRNQCPSDAGILKGAVHDEDLYEILQVSRTAEPEVIVAAYNRLARKYHPAETSVADAQQRLKELNRAFEVLMDPQKRADYDRRHCAPNESPESNPAARQPDASPHPYYQYAYPQQLPSPRNQGFSVDGCLKAIGVATLVAIGLVVRGCFYFMDEPDPKPTLATNPQAKKQAWSNPSEVCVANTQGEGVYLRSLPAPAYKTGSAYPEGTKFSVDDERECHPGSEDSGAFCAVEAPDGTTGYLPSRYVEYCDYR